MDKSNFVVAREPCFEYVVPYIGGLALLLLLARVRGLYVVPRLTVFEPVDGLGEQLLTLGSYPFEVYVAAQERPPAPPASTVGVPVKLIGRRREDALAGVSGRLARVGRALVIFGTRSNSFHYFD